MFRRRRWWHHTADSEKKGLHKHSIAGNGARFQGFTLLKSGRGVSSALTEIAGHSRPYASRYRVHSRRWAHVVGGREQQRIGRNSWGPIRDDWRRAASLVLALQIWPVASRNRKVALVAVPPGLLLKTSHRPYGIIHRVASLQNLTE